MRRRYAFLLGLTLGAITGHLYIRALKGLDLMSDDDDQARDSDFHQEMGELEINSGSA